MLVCALILGSKRIQKNDYVLVGLILTVVGSYSLYWFNGGPDFGARYWFLTVIPFLILAVRGIQSLEQRLSSSIGPSDSNGVVMVAVLSMCLLTLLNYIPWRSLDKYHHYLGMRPDIRSLAKEYNFGKSLVLIRGVSHPDYASAWTYNPLDPHAEEPVYAWDQSAAVRSRVLEAYRNRSVWIIEGPSVTGTSYKVVAAPSLAHPALTRSGKNEKR